MLGLPLVIALAVILWTGHKIATSPKRGEDQ
jgi:hypothetical protein